MEIRERKMRKATNRSSLRGPSGHKQLGTRKKQRKKERHVGGKRKEGPKETARNKERAEESKQESYNFGGLQNSGVNTGTQIAKDTYNCQKTFKQKNIRASRSAKMRRGSTEGLYHVDPAAFSRSS